jgi:cytochrome P450
VPSFVTLRDEAKVTALKKHINTAFTARATLDYEPHIDESLRILMQRLEVEGGNKADINLAKWVSVFTFETISRIAFSDDDISVDDIEATLAGAKSRFDYWHKWFILPVWERLIYRNPFTKGMTVTSTLGARASARVRERYDNGGLGTHTDLLDRYLQGGSKSPETFTPTTVTGLVISTIHAGSETTAVTLNITMYYLFHNPQTLAALRKELEAADLSSPPTYQSVMKLPYLEASIKETQRMNILNNNPLEREVHPEGATISGVFIPGGTMVAANVHVINRNPEIWGDDPDVYRPERWLEADEARRSKMERASLGFGGGKRFCLGRNIAWIEMKKALPDLLMRFDVSYLHPCHIL